MKSNYTTILIAFIIVLTGFVVYYGNDATPSDFKFEGQTETIEEESEYFDIEAEHPSDDVIGSGPVKSFVDNRVSEFKDLANQEVPELKQRGFNTKYSLLMNLENYQSRDYFSHVLFINEYTGGANANQTVESFIYDKETGKEVVISDVLSGNGDDFIEKVKDNLYSRESEIGIFRDRVDNLSIDSISSFYVTDDNIVVLFSKYEVAPGVSGIVEVNVSRD